MTILIVAKPSSKLLFGHSLEIQNKKIKLLPPLLYCCPCRLFRFRSLQFPLFFFPMCHHSFKHCGSQPPTSPATMTKPQGFWAWESGSIGTTWQRKQGGKEYGKQEKAPPPQETSKQTGKLFHCSETRLPDQTAVTLNSLSF